MNTEYSKFDHRRKEYNPPVIHPGHFSNLPEVLVPSQHVEVGADPIEKEEHQLIRESVTPPATPPELEPGRAGCKVFGKRHHYVDPIYEEDDKYRRKFVIKLILLNTGYYAPTCIFLLFACIWRNFDIILVKTWEYFAATAFIGILGGVTYPYFVSLLRNKPYTYIGYGVRMALTTMSMVGMVCCFHYVFLKIGHIDDIQTILEGARQHKEEDQFYEESENAEEEKNATSTSHQDDDDETIPWHFIYTFDFKPLYSPPYLGIVLFFIHYAGDAGIILFIWKLKFRENDFRIPVFVYSICFTLSPILVTAALNNGFGYDDSKGYDVLQIVLACYGGTLMLMRLPHNISRLLDGLVCPLREGEIMYAALHYGF